MNAETMPNNNARNLILYHAECIDGFTAAWVANHAHLDAGCPVPKLLPVAYGQEPPTTAIHQTAVAGGWVYILDFSYPREVMERLITLAEGRLVCLDHHKTAAAALDGLPECFFDAEHSGAWMAWVYFHTAPPPALVRRVSDNDTGRRVLPHASAYNALIGSYPFELGAYDELARRLDSEPADWLVQEGLAIRREQKKRVEQTVTLARPVRLYGVEAWIACCSDRSQFSSAGVALAELSPDGVGGCWFQRADGRVEWSLRSLKPGAAQAANRPSVDVAKLAQRFGGGGHTHAAGFTQTLVELAMMLEGGAL